MSWEPERWERVKALFGEAAELPESDWAAFLARACPDDDNVRLEVLRLLGFGAEFFEDTGVAGLLQILVAGRNHFLQAGAACR